MAYAGSFADDFIGKYSEPKGIERAHIIVSNFDRNSAVIAVEFMSIQPGVCLECNKLNWKNVTIMASTYRSASIFVTENIKDFRCYVEEDKFITFYEDDEQAPVLELKR